MLLPFTAQAANQVVPNIFASQSGNVPASQLDANFASVLAQTAPQLNAAGSANTYTATVSPALTAYVANQPFIITFPAGNTGASTLNINSLGTANINKISSGSEASIANGDIVANIPYLLICDGTNFVLANPSSPATLSIPYNAMAGNLPTSISGTNTTAAVTISSGQATDSTNAAVLVGAGYSWAVSNGNAANGFHGGTTLPNSSAIHFFLCSGGSGTTSFADTQTTARCPTGYATYYRRIFSTETNGSGALIPYTAIETEGGAISAFLSTAVVDTSSSVGNSSRTLLTLSNVPSGVKMGVFWNFNSPANSTFIKITSPDEPDVAVGNGSFTTAPGYDWTDINTTSAGSPRSGELITNTSAQVGIRANTGSSITVQFITRGFKDYRRN